MSLFVQQFPPLHGDQSGALVPLLGKLANTQLHHWPYLKTELIRPSVHEKQTIWKYRVQDSSTKRKIDYAVYYLLMIYFLKRPDRFQEINQEKTILTVKPILPLR